METVDRRMAIVTSQDFDVTSDARSEYVVYMKTHAHRFLE